MGGDPDRRTIRVGSRKSELALIQTKHVISCLQSLNPDVLYEIHTMTTVGDRVLNKSLPKIGEKSLFTKDLEDALRTGGVDFVVHSLKDLPTSLPPGMAIGAVLERDDPRDALVLNERHRGKTLATLPAGSVVGTSSLRRSAQLARSYSHLTVCDIRGNLNTRLAKLDAESSKFAGIILAQAGLVRMGWMKRIDQVIEPEEILYAVGQGALAVECRSNDDYILGMLAKLCHLETQCRILTERSFLKTLGGGCSAPVAVRTGLKRKLDAKSYQLSVKGAVWSLDGKTEILAERGCELQLDGNEDQADEEEVVPVKRVKQATEEEADEVDRNVTLPQVGCPVKHGKKSPEIIQETLPGCSTDGIRLDLNKFIDIHGDIFKKCPYSTHLTKLAESAKEEKAKEEELCPSSNFPVGVDFMGDCPFVSTEQKVEQSGAVGLKCPISGQVKNGGAGGDADNGANQCPFLAEQAKILDYNENLNRIIAAPTIEDNSELLFCGMYRQKAIELSVFERCEKLGYDLAHDLIAKGALDVMKCAQNEIHSKV